MLAGCASKNELKGVGDIAAFYGGRVNWLKGAKAATGNDENTGKYFQIELDSADLKKFYETADLPAGNCAYLFYHSLSEKERNNYSFIRIIIPEYSPTDKYEVRTEILHRVEQCLPTLDRTVDCLKSGRYEVLRSLFTPIVPADSLTDEKLRVSNQAIDSMYGRIREFRLQGFYNVKADIRGRTLQLIRLSGNLLREKQNTYFSVTIDPDEKERNLCGYNFRR
jgi:hypothetical protein